MISEVDERIIVFCNNCPIQLDLGSARKARGRNRMPSGWINAGHDRHYCPHCTKNVTLAAMYAATLQPGTQALL